MLRLLYPLIVLALVGCTGYLPPVVVSVAPTKGGRLKVKKCRIDYGSEAYADCRVQTVEQLD